MTTPSVPECEDEMCAPGGMTWDEAAAFPNLADLECPRCGQIACECQ